MPESIVLLEGIAATVLVIGAYGYLEGLSLYNKARKLEQEARELLARSKIRAERVERLLSEVDRGIAVLERAKSGTAPSRELAE
jgi:TctA family transporter